MAPSDYINTFISEDFIRLVAERTGLKIRKNDQELFEESIVQRMQDLNIHSSEKYYSLLQSVNQESDEEWRNLIPAITNSESFFFRDKGQFKVLRTHILPEIIERQKKTKTLTICSAGCSTGEEPYSIAILLKQLIPDLAQWDIKILGLDINPIAIEKAQEGAYLSWSMRGLEDSILQQFFQQIDSTYYIDPEIRSMTTFKTQNLVKASLAALNTDGRGMDLIICRNVFIYFQDIAVQNVLNQFHRMLHPLGYLLVGHSELHGQNLDKFQIRVFEESLAYQRKMTHLSHTLQELTSVMEKNRQSMQELGQEPAPEDINYPGLEKQLQENEIQMHKVALGLLRQLPVNTKISRLGNRSASDAIHDIEQFLSSTEQD